MAVLEALEALKKASKDVEHNADDDSAGGGCDSPSMKALLVLQNGSDDLLSGDPHLSTLSSLLFRLKSLLSSPSPKKPRFPPFQSFLLRRHRKPTEISILAGSIGSELQSWIDRESLDRLLSPSISDDDKSTLLAALESRLSLGLDRGFQELLLRSGAYSAVESTLADTTASRRVRDLAALAVLAMVRFNKSVFVGEVLMGPAVRSLVALSSADSLRALNGLISAVRSPIIDYLHAHGELATIIALLSAEEEDVEIRALALDSVLLVGYLGRKEAIDAMMEEGLVERLVELQRSDLGGTATEGETDGGDDGSGGAGRERRGGDVEARPFASCVSRLAIQMEVGEGLRGREKREVKLEVLRRVREAAADSEAEMWTMIAEVLWGSTCW
ncbi:putative basic proline-rich protein-like [Iris pallida]|uniref:Basic proline-rich protein-like n=1 Tax=Iris pallida TaxID=29817 RepID=A0AAX6GSU2_IRIPA|nr:putative basic proline-rich protein-like [Iris pallida]